jgi:putative urate catabolism protein
LGAAELCCALLSKETVVATSTYPRDLIGYGGRPPHPRWPEDARIAIQFVLAYETGAETSILHGDRGSEAMLTDIAGAPAVDNARSMLVESTFEFGSRVGVWRLLSLLAARDIKCSVFGVATALEKNPLVVKAILEAGHEIVCHGYRWIDYQHVPEEVERDHIRRAVKIIEQLTGSRPLGWMTGRPSPNTRRLLVEEGGFLYDQDVLNDELPYWVKIGSKYHLCLPYSYETNDNAFSGRQGFSTGEQFFTYLREAFDFLYREGKKNPKVMTVAVHDRLTGRPGRASGVERFLDHVKSHDQVWIARGIDIARHWQAHFPPVKYILTSP